MTTSALDILIRAKDEASGSIHDVQSQTKGLGDESVRTSDKMESASSGAKKFGSSLKGIAAWAGGAIGIVGIGMFASKSLEAFDTLSHASKRLGVGLRAMGMTKDLDPLLDWSRKFSLSTGINEGDIVDMQSELSVMGTAFFKAAGPGAKADLDNLTGGLQNMASATGKSAAMLMRSLGPAILNTPAKAAPLLQKYGAVSETVANQLKALGATSKSQLDTMVTSGYITKKYETYVLSLSKAQRNQAGSTLAINDIQKKFNGTAAATATPLEKIGNYLNQVEIAAGRMMSGALGWLLNTGWPAFVGWIQSLEAKFQPFIKMFENAAAQVFPALKNAWHQLQPELAKLWQQLKPVAEALGVIIALVLYGALKALPYLIKAVATTIGWYIKFESILIGTVVRALQDVFNWGETAFEAVKNFAQDAWRGVQIVWNGAVGFFHTIWTGITAGVGAVWTGVTSTFKSVWNFIADGWNNTIGKLHFHVPGTSITFDVPDLPTLAKGGIATRATAGIFGEAGPEAILPLSRLKDFGIGGGMGDVVVALDRRRFVTQGDFETKYRGF